MSSLVANSDFATVSQRLAVAISCVVLFLMVQYAFLRESNAVYIGALATLSALACVEKLGSVLNTISVERDWVVTVASGDEKQLQCEFLHLEIVSWS